MTKNQIYNIFCYCGIMLLDNKLIMTSPDYIEEKTLSFLGKMGKDEFIKYPIIRSNSQRLTRTRRRWNAGRGFVDEKVEYSSIFDSFEGSFWEEYCKIWGVDVNNYRFMNVINYLLDINFYKHSSFFNGIQLYFGDMDGVSDEDLDYKVHPALLAYLDDNIDFDSRYLKLKSLE